MASSMGKKKEQATTFNLSSDKSQKAELNVIFYYHEVRPEQVELKAK